MNDAHPLFPIESEGAEPCEVGWIHVTRFEGGGQKWAPRLFAASELADLEALADAFGGGSYELVARSHDRRTITARRRYQLSGRPLPLDGGPVEDRAPAVAMPAPSGTSDALLIAMMQMMGQQQQATTQLMVAMLTKADQTSKEHTQSMTALHDRFAQSQAALFAKVLEASSAGGGAGGGGVDGFMRGIEFAQEMAAGAAEAHAEGDDGGSDLKDLLEGFKMFATLDHQQRLAQVEAMKAQQPQQRPPPKAPQKPQGNPPPNGAASA